MYLKYPISDTIQRMHLRTLWIIWINNPVLDLTKKNGISIFRIKSLDSDFGKETRRNFLVYAWLSRITSILFKRVDA